MNNSELKTKADISLRKAKELILQTIPNEEIISIYIKGSYVQDELTSNSDVDLVVILKTEKYLPVIYELTDKFGITTIPSFQIVSYTLNELLTGERATNRTKNITPVSSFVKHMDMLPLIYGSKPSGKLFTRTNEKDFSTHISAFKNSFLPEYYAGKFKFDELIKQVFWLVEREQRTLGRNPEYSWQKLADSIEDKNHIIHSALKLRRQTNITQEEKDLFIEKLNSYLKV
jgi:predicted nucleotidyltransferase